MITLIDYGVGNIFAFQNVYKRLDIPTKIAKTAADLEDAQKAVKNLIGKRAYNAEDIDEDGTKYVKLVIE